MGWSWDKNHSQTIIPGFEPWTNMGTRGFGMQWIGFNDHLYRKPFILLSIFFLSAFRFLNFPIFSQKKQAIETWFSQPLLDIQCGKPHESGDETVDSPCNSLRTTRDGDFSRLDGAGFQIYSAFWGRLAIGFSTKNQDENGWNQLYKYKWWTSTIWLSPERCLAS